MTCFTQKALKVLALPLIYTGNVILNWKLFNNNNKKKIHQQQQKQKKKKTLNNQTCYLNQLISLFS